MKSAYVKPTMMFEGFQPTEYVAACYTITCVGSAFYDDQQHTCLGGNFEMKDGKHGNHQDNQPATLNGVETPVLTSKGVSNWGEVLSSAVKHGIDLNPWTEPDWEGFWNSFRSQTTTMYLYGSHVSESPSYLSHSNVS